jgi:acyl-[acyl-carrier-protein]-phospholipid O-acyltransferase/long-chain-fatty-acid--[acyl-carrier-protein] ligase
MTTFLAIIVGFTAAGELKEAFGERLWLASLACVGIAVAGTLTSLLVRSTPVAHPGLSFQVSALAINPETRGLLRRQRGLLTVLFVSSIFWFIGGVVYPSAINDLGELQHRLGPALTGRLAACTGIGISVGCMIAGRLSQNRFDARLIVMGGWGMFFCLVLLAAPGLAAGGTLLGVAGAAAALIGLGLCAGLYTVPLQVYLQAKAPLDQKGRIIATMNLMNWIGIATAGLYYHGANVVLSRWSAPPAAMFAAAALLLLPVIIWYRPKSEPLVDAHGEESGGLRNPDG